MMPHNFWWGGIVEMARGKEDQSLYEDIVNSSEEIAEETKFDADRIPDGFPKIRVTGLAQDRAYEITTAIVGRLGQNNDGLNDDDRIHYVLEMVEKSVRDIKTFEGLRQRIKAVFPARG